MAKQSIIVQTEQSWIALRLSSVYPLLSCCTVCPQLSSPQCGPLCVHDCLGKVSTTALMMVLFTHTALWPAPSPLCPIPPSIPLLFCTLHCHWIARHSLPLYYHCKYGSFQLKLSYFSIVIRPDKFGFSFFSLYLTTVKRLRTLDTILLSFSLLHICIAHLNLNTSVVLLIL